MEIPTGYDRLVELLDEVQAALMTANQTILEQSQMIAAQNMVVFSARRENISLQRTIDLMKGGVGNGH